MRDVSYVHRGTAKVLLHFIFVLTAALHSLPASAQKVRISNLTDVNYGLITNLQADSRRSQSFCLFDTGGSGTYSVSASGSGSGSSFALANGPTSLAYDVEWSDRSGQTLGTRLTPNVAMTGQTSAATQQFCNAGPSSSASLMIVLRSADLEQAREGSYSGSLTLLIAAE